MAFKISDYLPVLPQEEVDTSAYSSAEILDDEDKRRLKRAFRPKALSLGFTPGGFFSSSSRRAFESPPYDFERILKAEDTDSYVKQGLNKYRELIWKEGWDIVGENVNAVEYLHQRLDFMELTMQRPFHDFLVEVADQLVKFGNCFIGRARGDITSVFPGNIEGRGNQNPIVGYYVIPAETVEIQRDTRNNPIRYRQTTHHAATTGVYRRKDPEWRAADVIHLAMDKKPGRVFGTPFMVSVLDDVIALRQLEEDIQNLTHKELFPFYKYIIGTPEDPPTLEQMQEIINEIEHLQVEGGLALPANQDIDVVGDSNSSLDASGYLKHFLGRVCAGLGLSPHHLGIMLESTNRSITDRLDIALYDKVKTYQRYISDMVRLHIFNELLLEAGYDPFTSPITAGLSDRCIFKFNEIDVDTQIKRENHEIQKFAQQAITLPELRLLMGYDPDVDETQLHQAVMTRLMPDPAAPGSSNGGGSNNTPRKPDANTPARKGQTNPRNTVRSVGNKVRPSNQHGRRTSPNVTHAIDNNLLDSIEELLDEDNDV